MSNPVLAFASVFLSLVIGEHTVEVVVGDSVDRVEILLDDAQIGTLEAPPWRLTCDFGQALRPHRLEAVAYDAEDREIYRTGQWINLPQPPAEVQVLVEEATDGQRYAKLVWTHLLRDPPVRIELWFDGVTVEVTDVERIPLPPHDISRLHFLRAELEFPQNVVSVVEVTFGGAFSDQVNAELMALPIQLASPRREPSIERLQPWFRSSSGPIRVAAVDKGPAEIVVVRDQNAQPALDRLARERHFASARAGASSYATRFTDRLVSDQSIGFLWPFMERSDSGIWTFPATYGWFSARDGGLAWFLDNYKPVPNDPEMQQLADAVAVAGMNAMARNRRRAVVLILGETPVDNSRLDPANVRRYLETIGVPLYVWSPFEHGPDSPWGEVRPISTPAKYRSAVTSMSEEVDLQRIVWFDGRHLPQEIELASEAAGVSLAARR